MRWIILAILASCTSMQAAEARAPGLEHSEARSLLDGGAPSLAPFAHVRFCKVNPEQCRSDGGAARLTLNRQTLATIRSVNMQVNRSIRPVNDRNTPLGDVWTLSPRQGDCDDFAVTKRQALIRAGFSAAALRLLVATTSWGEGHAVLVVATNGGDLVLDNMTDRVRSLAETGLRPIKVQSSADPRRWLAVGQQAVASRN
ncbi:transglutaminase-like cysteine peptidase [Aureimonas sp. AU4]|uniref:transglutaminase-like cysteine peptidase n=1 Tax=Aureimonas sp. AU4 TaxID=1638163 RepID=UPI000782E312|nr:transglutaminase-like cysteine peptidase [Aureimonas sp. AU4]